MARLLQLTHSTGTTATRLSHPRTKSYIRKFGLKRVTAWNEQGAIGGSFLNSAVGGWGVLEIYDSASATPAASDLIMRIPVSAKSRLSFDLPGHGLVLKNGVVLKIASDQTNNGNKEMSVQLLGYEYSMVRGV